MRRTAEFETPFEDEELESLAWSHYEAAREQGSVIPEDILIRECREIAHQHRARLEQLGAEPVELDDGE